MFQPVPQVLQHASFIPAAPAEVLVYADPSSTAYAYMILDVQIGEAAPQTFTVGESESLGDFLMRIVAAGVTDENGKNPLTVSFEPGQIAIRSGARLRLSNMLAHALFFEAKDVGAAPARVIDTVSTAVLHGEELLSETLAGLSARYTDPRSIVVGQRLHPPFASLVSLGATEGDTIEIYHGSGYDAFTVDASVSALDFVAFVQNSQGLNSAFGNRVDAYVDARFQNVVVYSKTNQPLMIMATRTATFASIFGAFPA